jgi:hypothetical protein
MQRSLQKEEATIDVHGVCHFRLVPHEWSFWTDVPYEDAEKWIAEGKFTYIPLTDGHLNLGEHRPKGIDFPKRLGYITSAHIDPVAQDIVFTGKLFKSRIEHLNLTKTGGLDLVSLTHTVSNGVIGLPLEVAIVRLDKDAPRRNRCFMTIATTPLSAGRARIDKMTKMRAIVAVTAK